MKLLLYILAFSFLMFSNNAKACDGLQPTVTSNTYIGNGEYLLTIEMCAFVSNGTGSEATGILIDIVGANVISVQTPSVTSSSTGLTIFPNINSPTQVEFGDWGNDLAPIFQNDGDPQECWTIEIIVDGSATSVGISFGSSNDATAPGNGMVSCAPGVWCCNVNVPVPPVPCTPPDLILDDQTLCAPNTFDLNNAINPGSQPGNATFYNTSGDANTATNAIGSVVGTTGTYYVRYEDPLDPSCYMVGAVTITINPEYDLVEDLTLCTGSDYTYPDGTTSTNITVDESHTSNLTTVAGCDSVIVTNLTISGAITTTENVSICPGEDYTYPDGTISTNVQSNETNVSTLISVISGCDSIITTNLAVISITSSTEDFTICPGEDYTYPDGTISTNVQSNETHVSTLTSVLTGCDSTVTTNLTVSPIPSSTEDFVVCEGDDYTYPDGTVSTSITVDESHLSTLTSVAGCDSLVTTNLTVSVPIDADFDVNITDACVPKEFVFTDNSNGNVTCNWDFGNGATSISCGNQSVTYSEPGDYTIVLTIDDGCYSDTAVQNITLTSCDIFVPNVLSLSSTVGNNIWYVTSEGLASFTCVILNRWGNVITTLNEAQDHWDGKTKSGQFVEEGTYFYKLEFTYSNGETGSKHGFIQVIK